jgi:hypothetical protein
MCAAVSLLNPIVVLAQTSTLPGTRAAGLGAFVAVADDASAVVWNPAGLVSGPFFNLTLGLTRARRTPGDEIVRGERASDQQTALFATGVPPLGLSYYRIGTAEVLPGPSSGPEGDRRLREQVIVRRLVTSHVGATLLQSLGDYATVGATVKVVRGSVGRADVQATTWNDALDRADTIDTRHSIRADVDLGVMTSSGRVRAGAVVRNVTEPRFGTGDPALETTLDRQARIGVAWGDLWPGTARTIVAVDVDATRVSDATGSRRDLAVGVERWLRTEQLALRGGIRASTWGDARPAASAGVSFAVRSGLYADAHIAKGGRGALDWGISARLSY